MAEMNNGDVGSPEINGSEVNEVIEVDDFAEMDDELSQELDEHYNAYLNGEKDIGEMEVIESDDSIEKNDKTECDELKGEAETAYSQEWNDLSDDSLEAEMDRKYNEYMECEDEASDSREENVDGSEVTLEKIDCRNERLAGAEHPETGVPFEKRNIEVDGKTYEVVVPHFESIYDAQLPESKLKDVDREQFKECNTQLKAEIANNEKLRERFDDEQLEQIENGDTPDGYTWHHDADVGKMQLVDTEIHQKTGHTGGRVIWGGGNDNR